MVKSVAGLPGIAVAVCLGSFISVAQESARSMLEIERPLTDAEIARIFETSRDAMSGKTFRVILEVGPAATSEHATYGVQMGPGGWPQFQRSLDDPAALWSHDIFEEYTGRPAQTCDGRELSVELVRGYAYVPYATVSSVSSSQFSPPGIWDGWTDDGLGGKYNFSARVRTPNEVLGRIFDPFSVLRKMKAGGLASIEGHRVRAFIKSNELRPGDYSAVPIPPERQEYLWIDVDTLYLFRWEITESAISTGYGVTLVADSSLDMRPRPEFDRAEPCVRPKP
jgi:hypothetical protein